MRPKHAKQRLRVLKDRQRALEATEPERKNRAIRFYGADRLVAYMWKIEYCLEWVRVKNEIAEIRKCCDHSCGFDENGYCLACEANILYVQHYRPCVIDGRLLTKPKD